MPITAQVNAGMAGSKDLCSHSHASSLSLACSPLMACALLMFSSLMAQEQRSTPRAPKSATRRFAPNAAAAQDIRHSVDELSFQKISRAETEGQYHLHQVRRVLDGKNWLAIREELWIAPGNAGGDPHFKLTLEGVEGRAVSEAELIERRNEFSNRSAFLFLHSACRIIDPTLAQENYGIFDLGPGMRIDRPVQKIFLLPRRVGSTPWALELDQETGYPLYRAEYDRRGQITSTLEVTQFQHGLPAHAPRDLEWWQETRSIDEYPDLDSAQRAFPGRSITLPDPSSLPIGYDLLRTRVVHSDLNDEQTLVQVYSDGIDELFLLTTTNLTTTSASPPELLSGNSGDGQEVTLMVFRDLSTSQLMFYHGGLRYQIIGHPGAGRLNSMARSLIRKAYR